MKLPKPMKTSPNVIIPFFIFGVSLYLAVAHRDFKSPVSPLFQNKLLAKANNTANAPQ